MDIAALVSTLSNVEESSLEQEQSRMDVLLAARALVRRIEKPWERMTDLVWQQPILTICLKTCCDLQLFQYLNDKPQTVLQLAKHTGADPILIGRLLRVLATAEMVHETDVDTYTGTSFSAALVDPDGLVRGIHHYYDVGVQQTTNLPQYLKSIEYCSPNSQDQLAFKYNMGLHDFDGDWWDFYQRNPQVSANFNKFLSSLRTDQPAWTDSYPTSLLFGNYDTSAPLLVDVGGGLGQDISYVADLVVEKSLNARLVLQEREEVITSLATSGQAPSHVELMVHNFFEPQPVQGAKFYFLHSVLHDWPDAQAEGILMQIKGVMKPKYSKILLFESVMPSRARDASLTMAAMDINMMAHFAALERTLKQWRQLVERCGLRYVNFYPSRGRHQGLIEIEI